MTDLVPQVDPEADLTELLKKLLDQKPSAKAAERPSNGTKLVEVAEDARKAVSAFYDRLRAVEVPSTRRELTPEEAKNLLEVTDLAKKAKQAIAKVEGTDGVAREAVFNAMDVALEWAHNVGPGEAPYPIDSRGHYLAKQSMPVPGTGKRFSRELRENAPSVLAADLHRLYLEGKITRGQYLRATRRVDVPRELNPEGLAAEIRKDPDLLQTLAEAGAITPGDVTASFHIREDKGED